MYSYACIYRERERAREVYEFIWALIYLQQSLVVAVISRGNRSHLQLGSLEVGSFHTPPMRLLQAGSSFWEWYGSFKGD